MNFQFIDEKRNFSANIAQIEAYSLLVDTF